MKLAGSPSGKQNFTEPLSGCEEPLSALHRVLNGLLLVDLLRADDDTTMELEIQRWIDNTSLAAVEGPELGEAASGESRRLHLERPVHHAFMALDYVLGICRSSCPSRRSPYLKLALLNTHCENGDTRSTPLWITTNMCDVIARSALDRGRKWRKEGVFGNEPPKKYFGCVQP